MFLILLAVYLGVELLGCKHCLTFCGTTTTIFKIGCTILCFPSALYEDSNFLVSSPILVHFHLLIIAILICVMCYFTVVLICISLMTNEVEHFPFCLLAIMNLIWGNICLGPLLFLFLSFCLFLFLGLHPWHMEVPKLGV